jgi:hypothetical protein
MPIADHRQEIDFLIKKRQALKQQADAANGRAKLVIDSQSMKDLVKDYESNIEIIEAVDKDIDNFDNIRKFIIEALDNKNLANAQPNEEKIFYIAIACKLMPYRIPNEISKLNTLANLLAAWLYYGRTYFSRSGPIADNYPVMAFFKNLIPTFYHKHVFEEPTPRQIDKLQHKVAIEEAALGLAKDAKLAYKMIEAIRSGDVATVTLLLKCGYSVDICNQKGKGLVFYLTEIPDVNKRDAMKNIPEIKRLVPA